MSFPFDSSSCPLPPPRSPRSPSNHGQVLQSIDVKPRNPHPIGAIPASNLPTLPISASISTRTSPPPRSPSHPVAWSHAKSNTLRHKTVRHAPESSYFDLGQCNDSTAQLSHLKHVTTSSKHEDSDLPKVPTLSRTLHTSRAELPKVPVLRACDEMVR